MEFVREERISRIAHKIVQTNCRIVVYSMTKAVDLEHSFMLMKELTNEDGKHQDQVRKTTRIHSRIITLLSDMETLDTCQLLEMKLMCALLPLIVRLQKLQWNTTLMTKFKQICVKNLQHRSKLRLFI